MLIDFLLIVSVAIFLIAILMIGLSKCHIFGVQFFDILGSFIHLFHLFLFLMRQIQY